VDFALHGKRFKMRPFVAVLLIFSLVFSMLSLVLVKQAEAKTSRLAVIASLGGDVTVKKGGGSKSYDAYEGMSLNQGDTLFTGSGASVILNVSNGDSEITLGEDSEFNISDLAGSGSGKISKLKMWAGSMWVKVKSLAGSNDQFEVETPTAVMGVRGTQFFVGVEPNTGKSKLAVGAGVVSATVSTSPVEQGTKTASSFGLASPPPEDVKKEVVIYPTQQLTLDSREESKNLAVKIEPLDIEGIVKSASANVIQAIIENKASIDKENADFIEKKKQEIASGTNTAGVNSTFVVKNIEELNKVIVNLDNLVGNIAKSAVDTNKVDKSTMDKLIEMANKGIVDPSQKLDLNNVKPFDKTAGVDPDAEKLRLEQLKKLVAEQAIKLQEEKKQQDELKIALAKVLKVLEETKKALEEANRKAIEEAMTNAEAVFLKNLNDAEKAKYKKNQANNTNTSIPITTPTPTSEPASEPETPQITPKVSRISASDLDGEGFFTVTVELKDFVDADKLIYGAKLHLVYSNSIKYKGIEFPEVSVFRPEVGIPEIPAVTSSSLLPSSEPTTDNSVYNVSEFNGERENELELVFVVTKFGSTTAPVSVPNSGKTLVKLIFHVDPVSEHDKYLYLPDGGIILVNKSGNTIQATVPAHNSDHPIFSIPGPTPSPSPTASPSPSESPTASASPSPSPTASASPSPSESPTASPTASPSETPSPSPSESPTASPA
jgi:hypothetical protein